MQLLISVQSTKTNNKFISKDLFVRLFHEKSIFTENHCKSKKRIKSDSFERAINVFVCLWMRFEMFNHNKNSLSDRFDTVEKEKQILWPYNGKPKRDSNGKWLIDKTIILFNDFPLALRLAKRTLEMVKWNKHKNKKDVGKYKTEWISIP